MNINKENLINNYVNKLKKNKIAIYLFHGVINQNNFKVRNYTRKHLDFNFFHKLLLKLKKNGYCVSMDDILNFYI